MHASTPFKPDHTVGAAGERKETTRESVDGVTWRLGRLIRLPERKVATARIARFAPKRRVRSKGRLQMGQQPGRYDIRLACDARGAPTRLGGGGPRQQPRRRHSCRWALRDRGPHLRGETQPNAEPLEVRHGLGTPARQMQQKQ